MILWLIRSELYCFGIKYKKSCCIAFIDREQTIYGSITQALKKIAQNDLSINEKQS